MKSALNCLSSSLNLLSNNRHFTFLSITFYFLPYYVKMENNNQIKGDHRMKRKQANDLASMILEALGEVPTFSVCRIV